MRAEYEIVDSQRGAWNKCFIRNAHEISLNLPDLILWENTPEKTRDFRSSQVTRLSKLSTRRLDEWKIKTL